MAKTALITGAAKGIGAAVARKLSSEGYDILINYAHSAEAASNLISELSGSSKALLFQADISDPAQVTALFDYCSKEFGRLDVLVNNASYSSSKGWNATASFDQFDWNEWEKTIHVDLKGTMLCSHAAFRMMGAQKYGKIINFSSSASIYGDIPTYFYTPAKFAIVGVTRALSRVFAPNIQVNCIAPGSIATEWIEKWKLTPAEVEAIGNESPLKRIGKPEEVAELVAFLASDRCNFMTGQTFAIDGGILYAV